MDISKLDPTLQGVIIGSVLSLAGNFLLQLFAYMGESFQWSRKRKAEKEDEQTREKKTENDSVRNIYTNCIASLSLIASNNRSSDTEIKLTEDELSKKYNETFEWISKLKLHQRDLYSDTNSEFHKLVESFMGSPDFYAGRLLNEINTMFVSDKLLFPTAEPIKKRPRTKRIQIAISHIYRRQQIIEGIEITRDHIISYDISELSKKQREILWDIHFKSRQAIPESIVLMVPRFDETKREIDYGSKPWEGRLNPTISSPRQVFDAWEKDYLDELEKANEALRLFKNLENNKS